MKVLPLIFVHAVSVHYWIEPTLYFDWIIVHNEQFPWKVVHLSETLRGNRYNNITEQKYTDFVDNFKKVKTYYDFLSFLNGDSILDQAYRQSFNVQTRPFEIRSEIQDLISLGIGKFGVFEEDDELLSLDKIAEYKDFINLLKI